MGMERGIDEEIRLRFSSLRNEPEDDQDDSNDGYHKPFDRLIENLKLASFLNGKRPMN